MKQGSEFDSPLQTAHLCFFKGVPPTGLCCESVARSLCNFIISALPPSFSTLYSLSGYSGMLTKIVHADIPLGAYYRKCWIAEFTEACVGLRAADTYANGIKGATPLPLQGFVVDLR